MKALKTIHLSEPLNRIARLHWIVFSVTLGFASVVEWCHVRAFITKKQWLAVGLTGMAAIASGFMASEALTRDWPSWEKRIP